MIYKSCRIILFLSGWVVVVCCTSVLAVYLCAYLPIVKGETEEEAPYFGPNVGDIEAYILHTYIAKHFLCSYTWDIPKTMRRRLGQSMHSRTGKFDRQALTNNACTCYVHMLILV